MFLHAINLSCCIRVIGEKNAFTTKKHMMSTHCYMMPLPRQIDSQAFYGMKGRLQRGQLCHFQVVYAQKHWWQLIQRKIFSNLICSKCFSISYKNNFMFKILQEDATIEKHGIGDMEASRRLGCFLYQSLLAIIVELPSNLNRKKCICELIRLELLKFNSLHPLFEHCLKIILIMDIV